MRTPAALIGRVDPATDKPFGNEIKRGLGTTHLPTARKLRDIERGRIQELERRTVEGLSPVRREVAASWADEVAAQDVAGGPDGPDAVDVREIAAEIAERAEMQPRSRRPPAAEIASFRGLVLGRGVSLAKAVESFLEARAPGNAGGIKPLAPQSQLGVRTAAKLLAECIGKPADEIRLADVTADEAHRFRHVWLPARPAKRGPRRLSWKSIDKHVTLLAAMWDWAVVKRHVAGPNLWRSTERQLPKARRVGGGEQRDDESRRTFTVEEAGKMLAWWPRGDRLGDFFRLALVTGCRAGEIVQLRAEDVDEDGGGFTVRAGKTVNAARWVPVPVIARGIVKARRGAVAQHQSSGASAMQEGDRGRLFFEFPVEAKAGPAGAVSKAFARARQKALGEDTDGELVLHSTRHTWRTEARRAGVRDDVAKEIGGWAGTDRSSASIYDHGMRRDQLRKAQERVAAAMAKAGLLVGF